MTLPDISRFATIPLERWRTFGERLRELELAEAATRIAVVGGQVFPPLCRPLRRFHVARMSGPVAVALRLFSVEEAVPAADVARTFGEALARDLEAVGLLVPDGEGRLRSALKLGASADVLFFADDLSHGGEAVMGPGTLTTSLLRALPASDAKVQSALDLGCGAAVLSIHLARRIPRVVATDINPRALAFAAVNAAMNGVSNIELRGGDLFAPVADERFDLIFSQPPFIPLPDGEAPATYMYGGSRGDELPLRLLAGLGDRLSDRGRGLVIAEIPVFSTDPVEPRVRAATGPGTNLLFLTAEGSDLDAFCIGDAAYEHPDFGPDFVRKVTTRREHLERLGVASIACALIVVERASQGAGWTHTFETAALALGGEEIDSLVAAFNLVARGREPLLAARLALRENLSFAPKGELVRVLFDHGSAFKEVALNQGAHHLLALIAGAPTLGAAVRRFAKESRHPAEVATQRLLPIAEQFLSAGLLVPRPG